MNETETTEYLEQKERLIKELEIGENSGFVDNFDRDEFLKRLLEKKKTH